jgi:carbon-monoxide dehydrogenase medium subunit
MIRDRFEYHQPGSADEAVAVRGGDAAGAAVISGGTWTVPNMDQGITRPTHVVDLRRAGMSGVQAENGHVRIGPTTTYAQLSASPDTPPLLRAVADGITGGQQVRNRGTVGGSACYGNPASDVPGALVALEARMVIGSPRGQREVDAEGFFRGGFETAVGDDELLVGIVVARPAEGERQAYVKFKVAQGSWPIVTAGCRLDADGSIKRLVVGGAAATPVVVPPDLHDDASAAIEEPWSDVLAPAKYRKVSSTVIARRAVEAARATDTGAAQ